MSIRGLYSTSQTGGWLLPSQTDAHHIGGNHYKTKPIIDFSCTANYTFELFTYQAQQVNHALKGSCGQRDSK